MLRYTMHHEFTLPATALANGIAHMGTDAAHWRLFAKLRRGDAPVSVLVLGASVAENGGCLTQHKRRCMQRDGVQNASRLWWAIPQRQPVKGFVVRFFEWLNATWPHTSNSLNNEARDAMSLSSVAPCLASTIPPQGVDLVLIEAGSLYASNTPPMLEQLVRALSSIHQPPAIVFVTVHSWCIAHLSSVHGSALHRGRAIRFKGFHAMKNRDYMFPAGLLPGALARRASKAELGNHAFIRRWQNASGWSPSRSDQLEDAINALCARYSLSCLSTRDALQGGFYGGVAGFGIKDIAADCMHPETGRWGTEQMTDMLIYWMQVGLPTLACPFLVRLYHMQPIRTMALSLNAASSGTAHPASCANGHLIRSRSQPITDSVGRRAGTANGS